MYVVADYSQERKEERWDWDSWKIQSTSYAILIVSLNEMVLALPFGKVLLIGWRIARQICRCNIDSKERWLIILVNLTLRLVYL